MKPFLTPGGWQLVREMCVLKCFSGFEMRFYVQYRLVCESFAFVNACVEERSIFVRYFSRKLDGGVVAICLFKGLRDFVFVYIPDREDIINIPFPDEWF